MIFFPFTPMYSYDHFHIRWLSRRATELQWLTFKSICVLLFGHRRGSREATLNSFLHDRSESNCLQAYSYRQEPAKSDSQLTHSRILARCPAIWAELSVFWLDRDAKPQDLRGILRLDWSPITDAAIRQPSLPASASTRGSRPRRILGFELLNRNVIQSKRWPSGPFIVRFGRVSKLGKWTIRLPFLSLEHQCWRECCRWELNQ